MENFWQVCAALDNPNRLRLLDVLTINTPRCVTELSAYHDIGVTVISRYIRALDDVGFLTVEWRDRKAYYRTSPQNPAAAEILKVLGPFFNQYASDRSRVARLLKYIHALSHPRRAAIVRYLHRNPGVSSEGISQALGIAYPTTIRLLRDLDHAYIVDLDHNAIPPPSNPELVFFNLLVAD